MPIEFLCGQCQRTLRVPDDSAGREARCPQCGTISTVPSPAATAAEFDQPAAPPPQPTEANPYASPHIQPPGGSSDPAFAASRVNGPAIGLIVTGGIGVALAGLTLALNALGIGLGAADRGEVADQIMARGVVGIVPSAIGLVCSIVIIMGAMKMMKVESYGFAIAASIMAMLPCVSPCCLIGLPIGIWSLVVLNDADVKSCFR